MKHTCYIVVFGGNGDLATRKLFPSLFYLYCDGFLPQHVRLIGAARSDLNDESFRKLVLDKFKQYEGEAQFDIGKWEGFCERISYQQVDANTTQDFERLAERLALKSLDELVCYFSTSPKLFGDICSGLKIAGLTGNNVRVVLEKPIGYSLKSSKAINDIVAEIFNESNIFRIDHYLGKETVQNILALRFANSMFEPLWNNRNIDHIQITLAETVGVEGRWSYYNESGAFRDMVQSHILQLLALITMEPPADFEPGALHNEKVKVLRGLRPFSTEEVTRGTVRGQYGTGVISGESVSAYLDAGSDVANPDIETYVALRTYIDNWRWSGVPIYLRSGKRLKNRYSEIYIQFKDVPYSIFGKTAAAALKPNKLVIRLQPEETIQLTLMNKVPGLTHKGVDLGEVNLNLSLSEEYKQERRRMAYQRLFLDIINNDSTLFVRRDEVEAAWVWADSILNTWIASAEPLEQYAAGSMGPAAAYTLKDSYGHSWHDQ